MLYQTIRQPRDGWYRRRVQHGSCRRDFCAFSYRLTFSPSIEAFEVIRAPEAPEYCDLWLGDVRRGVLSGYHRWSRRFCSVLLEITDLLDHPVDSSVDGMERNGLLFFDSYIKESAENVAPVILSWKTNTVMGIAQAIRKEKSGALLPILADALEEAGCDDAFLLDHCRSTAQHGEACWAVDLILSV